VHPKSAVTYCHKRVKKVFDATGIPEAIPHRFRDTFAVTLLEQGLPLRAVSRALGHKSEAVTQRHYAKWTGKQQDQMDDYIAAGWAKRSRSTAKEKPTHAKRVG